jgi:hypothetical protein
MRKPLRFGLVLACFAIAAHAGHAAAPATSGGTPPTFGGHAVFCNGQYALCIKAYCPTPNGSPKAGGTIDCSCDILNGWSMGPDTCDDRAKNLVSTYSNEYNPGHKTVSCTSTSTLWAWCYGAPCKPDSKDPKKAVCTCPVEQSAAVILVPEDHCNTAACDKVWSAATSGESKFANDYFFKVGREKGYKPNPPARACSASAATAGAGGGR